MPDTRGKALVQFVIAPDGVVRMPEVASSTLSDPSVERCLANVARNLVFPRPRGGAVVVNYPIRF
jgi:transposase-like protein